MPEKKRYKVSRSESNTRLDHFLASKDSGYSRSQIKKLIALNLVKIDGKSAKPSSKVKLFQLVEVEPFSKTEQKLLSEDIPVEIIFEDSSILVVNKPAGMVVHPAPGHSSGTLVNAVLSKVKDFRPIMGELRPGIVHRLDKETSGVMVIAKNEKALANLSEQFKSRLVEKTYKAIIIGNPKDSFNCERSIARSDRDRKKMAAKEDKGREALTYFRTLMRYDGLAYLEAKPRTGRTHQIRVHLSNMGFPIVGDKLYSRKRQAMQIRSVKLREKVLNFPRQALHAHSINFFHPEKGTRIKFEAEVSKDMSDLLAYLEEFQVV